MADEIKYNEEQIKKAEYYMTTGHDVNEAMKDDFSEEHKRLTKILIKDIKAKLDSIEKYNNMNKPMKIKSLLVDIERLAKLNKGNF